MQNLDIMDFDPLSRSMADNFVQEVMVPTKVTTTAQIHHNADYNTVSNSESDFNINNGEKTVRNKRRLSNETSNLTSVKKLKSNNRNCNDVIGKCSQTSLSTMVIDPLTSNYDKSEISELKTLVVGITDTMSNFCNMITRRMDDFENNIPSQIASMIDKRVSTEMQKVKEQFQSELQTVATRMENIEKTHADMVKRKSIRDDNEDKFEIVIRNMPETEKENVLNKVNGLLRDGLHLKDIQFISAERKRSFKEGKYGVIVASLPNAGDKRKVLESKRKLKDSRNFRDIFIENSIPKAQRLINSNMRNIVNAIGNNRLEIKGNRVQFKSAKTVSNNESDMSDIQQRCVNSEPINDGWQKPNYTHRNGRGYGYRGNVSRGNKTNQGRGRH